MPQKRLVLLNGSLQNILKQVWLASKFLVWMTQTLFIMVGLVPVSLLVSIKSDESLFHSWKNEVMKNGSRVLQWPYPPVAFWKSAFWMVGCSITVAIVISVTVLAGRVLAWFI